MTNLLLYRKFANNQFGSNMCLLVQLKYPSPIVTHYRREQWEVRHWQDSAYWKQHCRLGRWSKERFLDLSLRHQFPPFVLLGSGNKISFSRLQTPDVTGTALFSVGSLVLSSRWPRNRTKTPYLDNIVDITKFILCNVIII